ncbi:Uncharacterised protein [Weeksella virosa]|uniref:Uncharacterized protein n=1 Tax=Weeksella virosa (strain ATCC 43766 / DSM 16922 / JCM 21250 / CCUG 30538 / CDC 9751 / IAM 14551 / NBRC 16016 / NCTC 11634 / CL345/78) TaxID=865938 RepID=F0NXT6_WEEVC|nr:hypothetical protein Weevi_0271 [Weeksella virosa DSM 16922]VEH63277.1 Uncharacterised protein [Weeksella virosa]
MQSFPVQLIQSLPTIVKNEILFPKLNGKTSEVISERQATVNRLITMLSVKFENEKEMQIATAEMGTFLRGYNLTRPEVLEAYRMAIRGEFDIKLYPNLSLIQCGEILKSYQEFKNDSFERNTAIKKLKLFGNTDKKPSDEQLEIEHMQYLKTVYAEIKESGFSDKLHFYYSKFKNRVRQWDLPTKKRFLKYIENKLMKQKEVKFMTGKINEFEFSKIKKEISSGKGLSEAVVLCQNILISNYLKSKCECFEEFREEFK